MQKTTVLTVGLALVASTALASNTGFKINYPIKGPLNLTQTNITSFPYFYYATGIVGSTTNSKELCADLNDGVVPPAAMPKVAQVIRFDITTDVVNFQNCASAVPTPRFTMTVGEAYSLKPVNDTDQVVNIVGSMDDTFAKPPKIGGNHINLRLMPGSVLSQNQWISVPYHVKAVDSKQLCLDVNDGVAPPAAPKVTQIIKFDTLQDVTVFQNCASAVPTPRFTVVPGEGYSFKAAVDNAQINFDVY